MVCFCPTSVSRSPRPSLRSAFSNFLNILTRAWSGIMCSRFSLEMSKTGCFVCVSGIFRRKLTKEVYLGERRHCLTKVKCFLTRLILQWWSWWMNHSEWYRHPPAMIYKPSFRFTAKIWIGAIWYFDCCLQKNACDGQLGPCESSLDSFDCLRTMEPSEEEM